MMDGCPLNAFYQACEGSGQNGLLYPKTTYVKW